MADFSCDVDVALASVPVNILPLIDDTDFKTIEASVAYNASGMALKWNFTTTGGTTTQTAVTPTTSGTYDWTNLGNGMYAIEIPASGGASINNDTEGFGWFSGFAAGVLPWRGPTVCFRAAALNNSLVDAGTTGLLAPTTAARTLTVDASGRGLADVDTIKTNPVANGGTVTFPTNATLASTTNITAGTITTVTTTTTATNLTNAPTAGDFTATMKTSIGTAVAASAVASVTGNVGGNVTGSVGSVVGAVGSVTGAVGSVTGNVGGNVTGTVASVVGNVGGNVTGTVASVVGNIGGNLNGDVIGDLAGDVIGNVDGNLGGDVMGDIQGSVLGNVEGSTASVTDEVTADIAHINGTQVIGIGVLGNKWRPA